MRKLTKILNDRNQYVRGTYNWGILENEKIEAIEVKPSTKEDILFFNDYDITMFDDGFTEVNDDNEDDVIDYINNIGIKTDRRSKLEYSDGFTRHPIPYIIVKREDKDEYFFIFREKGSGEQLLQGKKGMIGGHVGDEGIEKESFTLHVNIMQGACREIQEEIGVDFTKYRFTNMVLKGVIKSNLDEVDKSHLGLIIQINIPDDMEITTQEEGVLSGKWYTLDEIKADYEQFENWSKIVIDNILIK